MKARLVFLPLLLLLMACQRGRDGKDGANGSNGLPGQNAGGTMFTYTGTVIFPAGSAVVAIPDFSLERGDVLNVYLRWHSGALDWSQIGANFVGGVSGWYDVKANNLTIFVVTGVDTDWLVNGVRKE